MEILNEGSPERFANNTTLQYNNNNMAGDDLGTVLQKDNFSRTMYGRGSIALLN